MLVDTRGITAFGKIYPKIMVKRLANSDIFGKSAKSDLSKSNKKVFS